MADFPIEVSDVTASDISGLWLGQAHLPNKSVAGKVMIFLRDEKYVAVSALCPHLRFDMSDTDLNEEGELVCARHGMVMNLYSDAAKTAQGKRANKVGYTVVKQGDGFVITGVNL
jgi:nitrite reductase/ring-hydroxylating ferredoxin subunit